MSRADRETRQLLFLFTNQSANTMDSTHDDEVMRDAAMWRCGDVCVDSGRTTQREGTEEQEEMENGTWSTHICGQFVCSH